MSPGYLAMNSSIDVANGQVLKGTLESAGATRTWLVAAVEIAIGVAWRVCPRYSIVAPAGKKAVSSAVCTAGSGPQFA